MTGFGYNINGFGAWKRPPPTGQDAYTTAGSYSWTCPDEVETVCVVCVGGGGGANNSAYYQQGGSGGGLGWKNDIAVTPGQSYTVVVGVKGYTAAGQNPGDSYFISTSTVKGGGGQNGNGTSTTAAPYVGFTVHPGGTYTGDGGGRGGWWRCLWWATWI